MPDFNLQVSPNWKLIIVKLNCKHMAVQFLLPAWASTSPNLVWSFYQNIIVFPLQPGIKENHKQICDLFGDILANDPLQNIWRDVFMVDAMIEALPKASLLYLCNCHVHREFYWNNNKEHVHKLASLSPIQHLIVCNACEGLE